MSVIVKLLVFGVLCVGGWFLTHRVIPFLVVRAGRLFGLKMRMTPLTEKRVKRFRGIRRGYWAFVIVTTAFVMSLFLELYVNHRALYVRYGDRVQMPAVAEWLNSWLPFADFREAARSEDFGLEGSSELDYRSFARWAGNPEELEKDALAVERGIEEDAVRFRTKMAEIAREKKIEIDPDGPLPEFKEREYAEKRAEAQTLRDLVPLFSSGEVGIVMPLYTYSPREQLLHLPGVPPHPSFTKGFPLLGTDFEGKDVLSQLFYGFRISFAFAVVVAGIGFTIGIAVGAVMGYFGGWVDIVVQRFIEIWASIPFLFTLMIMGSIYHPSFFLLAVLLVGLRAWIGITYTIRGEFYREKSRDYVQAARAIGVTRTKIMARHILPNALVPVVTFMPFAIVAYIGSLVSLDYLGFGLPPGTPSWGALLRQGADNIANHPDLVYLPVLAFAGTLFCVVTIGEAVREAFDPKLYSRLR